LRASRVNRTPFIVAGLVALSVEFLGGLLTEQGFWYKALNKPDWQPPGWLFAPVWTILFGMIAVSAAIAWMAATSRRERSTFVILFVVNAFVNVLWSALFFYAKRPDWALYEVAALWISVLALILATWPRSRLASALLLPYLAWVSFAAFLNATIVRLNPPFG
jgi:translocator protein